MTHEVTQRVERTFMRPSESLNSFKFLVPSIWSIDFMRVPISLVPWVVLAQIILFLGNFQIFKNVFLQRFFFFLVKENEEHFEILLNISFLKNINIQK